MSCKLLPWFPIFPLRWAHLHSTYFVFHLPIPGDEDCTLQRVENVSLRITHDLQILYFRIANFIRPLPHFFFHTKTNKQTKRIPFSRGRVIRSCNFPNTLLEMDPLNLYYRISLVWCKHGHKAMDKDINVDKPWSLLYKLHVIHHITLTWLSFMLLLFCLLPQKSLQSFSERTNWMSCIHPAWDSDTRQSWIWILFCPRAFSTQWRSG